MVHRIVIIFTNFLEIHWSWRYCQAITLLDYSMLLLILLSNVNSKQLRGVDKECQSGAKAEEPIQ